MAGLATELTSQPADCLCVRTTKLQPSPMPTSRALHIHHCFLTGHLYTVGTLVYNATCAVAILWILLIWNTHTQSSVRWVTTPVLDLATKRMQDFSRDAMWCSICTYAHADISVHCCPRRMEISGCLWGINEKLAYHMCWNYLLDLRLVDIDIIIMHVSSHAFLFAFCIHVDC